jgi:flagellar basal-body rod protein FlgF
MEEPTYVTLSAQVALQRELEVVANNVANASTAGFKADRQLFHTYLTNIAAPAGDVASVRGIGTYVELAPGEMQVTNNPFDVAVQGDGYLSVQSGAGIGYTRDGRLHAAADGTLVNAAAQPVLGEDGQPIQLPQNITKLVIRGDGTVNVTVNDAAQDVGRIATFRPGSAANMEKAGDGLFGDTVADDMQPIDPGDAASHLVQGAYEGSTVQPVREIANLTDLSRAYDRLQRVLADDDQRESKMIDALAHAG